MNPAAPDVGTSLAGGAVRVAIGSTVLVLPEGDIDSVESALDVLPGPGGDDVSCGSLDLGGERCPVFALDSGLGVVLVPPPKRRVCVVVAGVDGPIGFLADSVARLPVEGVRRGPLPACMRSRHQPFEGLVVHEGEIQLAMRAASLGAWICRAVRGVVSAGVTA